jgi:hypothetical protein
VSVPGATTQLEPVTGSITDRCVSDDHEWGCRGTLYPDQFDPAAHERGDDCPRCGRECDQVVNFEPDDVAAYRAIADAGLPGTAQSTR